MVPALVAATAARGSSPAAAGGTGAAAACCCCCLICLILSAAFAASCLPHSSSLVSSFETTWPSLAAAVVVVGELPLLDPSGSVCWIEAESSAAAAVEARRAEWGRVVVLVAGVAAPAVLARRAMTLEVERVERLVSSDASSSRSLRTGESRSRGCEQYPRVDCTALVLDAPRPFQLVVVECRESQSRLHRLTCTRQLGNSTVTGHKKMAPPKSAVAQKLMQDDPTLLPSEDEDDSDFHLSDQGGNNSSDSSDSDSDSGGAKRKRKRSPPAPTTAANPEPAIDKATVDDLWAQFNNPLDDPYAHQPTKTSASQPRRDHPELVTIEVEYEFAGEKLKCGVPFGRRSLCP